MIKVCVSTNPCKEDKLLTYAKEVQDLGIEYLHCDVMDGDFVKNKCLSYETLKNVAENTNILLDIHLMVSDVLKNVELFATLKPTIISFHYEALKSLKEFEKICQFLHSKQILIGLAIKPNTPVEIVTRLIQKVDLVLVMSVEPGKSGQKFIEDSYRKIEIIKDLTKNSDTIIEVDGGVNLDNCKKVINAGADFLVMGSAFFKSENKKELLHQIDKHYK